MPIVFETSTISAMETGEENKTKTFKWEEEEEERHMNNPNTSVIFFIAEGPCLGSTVTD